jgi:hypothetical protein
VQPIKLLGRDLSLYLYKIQTYLIRVARNYTNMSFKENMNPEYLLITMRFVYILQKITPLDRLWRSTIRINDEAIVVAPANSIQAA